MRFMNGSTAASLLIAGAAVLGAAPAYAGADDGQTKAFWSSQAVPAAQTSVDQNGRYVASYRQPYMQMDPRDAKASANTAGNVDANNVYFNHAKGTMTGDSGATFDSTGDRNGQYTASYQTPYMQMDPRDMKADSNAGRDVDGSNIYFNHAKGTMGGN